jgi:hypothetical protein
MNISSLAKLGNVEQFKVDVGLTFRKDRFYLYLPKEYDRKRVKVIYQKMKGKEWGNILIRLYNENENEGVLLTKPNISTQYACAAVFYSKQEGFHLLRKANTQRAFFNGVLSGDSILISDFEMPKVTKLVKRAIPKKSNSKKTLKIKRKVEAPKETTQEQEEQAITLPGLASAISYINQARRLYGVTIRVDNDGNCKAEL